MRRIGIGITAAAIVAFLGIGVSMAQTGPAPSNRGWSQMMMGPMAGCPMGAGHQRMMGPHMMGYDGNMMGPGMMWSGQWTQGSANIDPQLNALRSTLNIKKDQQGAWDAYASAARKDANSTVDMHSRMMGFMQGQTATAPSWLKTHRDMMRGRADSLGALASAVDGLYGKLDSKQKAIFDQYGGGMCGAW